MSETVELLQTLIRNACVNDGTPASGHEERNAEVLAALLGTTGLDVERYDAAPGRTSLVARIEGHDPAAPSLCLMGHTDVVPANSDGWSRDPFSGELVDGEVWGRGAVDMLNLTASMAVAFKELATSGFRPRGDLIYVAVADEESGSAYGAHWLAEHARDAVQADYVLTENGGIHTGDRITMTVGEKGVAWRRLRLRGTPGHGSMPFQSDNALVKAAAVAQRLAEYRPQPRFHELWRETIERLPVDDKIKQALLDPARVDDLLDAIPPGRGAPLLHANCHTTFSVNGVHGATKTNVIPDLIELDVDIRTLPGEGHDEVTEHLRTALGELADDVEIEVVLNDRSTMSRTDTPLWDSLQRAVQRSFPDSTLSPQFIVAFTDARVWRELGSVAYGAGLMSPALSGAEFGRRFHGNDERVDVESLDLTTQLWLDVARDLLG